ncbi:MAG: hypothetical protein NZ932_03970 [Candidatus Bathyarchaeota archaeon]|nr:hypothetical protein [Candidatus Bathyarchaeota archaeon]MDW8022374.1 hypothetical protein [Nitrososphaerota archaeon]
MAFAVTPRTRFRTQIIGYTDEQTRHPFYIGVSSGTKHEKVFLRLPTDRSFLSTILIEGPSGSGKSITTRVLLENFYIEWKTYGDRWRHPIIIFDSKTNYMGLDQINRKRRDRYLLGTIHQEWDYFLSIPRELIHVYMPAYVAPADKRTTLQVMREKWQAEGFWGVPWRHITDLAHLGTVLKVPEATLWVEELRPTFEKCSADPNMTLKGLIGVGGALHKAAKAIKNPASRAAALNFVERWRKNRFWFSEVDKLAQHLSDPFSINVLTFVETPEKVYFNQLAFLIALESLMATLQELKLETQPVIVIHDVLNFLGEDKPFRSQIIDVLRRLIITGQARTYDHGYVVIIESQSLDLPKELGDYRRYTVHIRLKWKSQVESLKRIPGFIGGIADIFDHYNNFYKQSVIIRPPYTSYVV